MDTHDITAFRKQLRVCIGVFVVLLIVTAITVGVTYLPLGRATQIAIQLTLAVAKAGLILAFFMHLLSEKSSTFRILGFTLVLFVALMGLILVARHDHPQLTEVFTEVKPALPVITHHVP